MATDQPEPVRPEPMKIEPAGNCIKDNVEKPIAKRPSNLCCYSQKECNLEKLKGFDFCHKHILEDKASPFKPCSFISKPNGKKCPNPAPNLSGREKTYCLIHTRDSELRKAVEERSKKRKRKHSGQSEVSETLVSKQTQPEIKNPSKRQRISEGENHKRDEMRVDSSWHGDYESDTESLDNEIDEPLRHAGIWTAEEVTKVCRDKLLRLRSLYMSQFERLKHVFKNKRRKYLLATKAHEEGDTNLTKKKEHLSGFDLATKSYNKLHRTDALLQRQSKDRRSGATSKGHHQILPHQRCTHYTDGNRCVFRIVPSTKFCIKHICHDPNQLLFLPCSQVLDGNERCATPVPNVLLHDKCLLHLPHVSELTGDDLKDELEKAKELQKFKDKEKEEKRKEALQKQESMSNPIVSAVQVKDEPKAPGEPPAIAYSTNRQPQLTGNFPSGFSKVSSPTTKSYPVKQPQSPATNLQIRIQPLKRPEFVFSDVAQQESNKQANDRPSDASPGEPRKVASSSKSEPSGTSTVDAQTMSGAGKNPVPSLGCPDGEKGKGLDSARDTATRSQDIVVMKKASDSSVDKIQLGSDPQDNCKVNDTPDTAGVISDGNNSK